MSLVIIEGPDGAGKTTLIESLRDNSTRYFAILRASGPPIDVDGSPSYGYAYMMLARQFAKSFPFPVVCDRFHAISENVYGPLLRGRKCEDLETIRVQLRGAKVVYCRPPLRRILANVQVHKQMAGVIEQTEALVSAYDALMEKISYDIEVFTYDYKLDSIDVLRKAIFS